MKRILVYFLLVLLSSNIYAQMPTTKSLAIEMMKTDGITLILEPIQQMDGEVINGKLSWIEAYTPDADLIIFDPKTNCIGLKPNFGSEKGKYVKWSNVSLLTNENKGIAQFYVETSESEFIITVTSVTTDKCLVAFLFGDDSAIGYICK